MKSVLAPPSKIVALRIVVPSKHLAFEGELDYLNTYDMHDVLSTAENTKIAQSNSWELVILQRYSEQPMANTCFRQCRSSKSMLLFVGNDIETSDAL